jgi:hypothetical protein
MLVNNLEYFGAAGFGALVGWYVYYINRYRKGDVQIGDLTTIIGVVGGAAITALFPASTGLFGAYGIGLFVGFFGYFLVLIYLVNSSANFDLDWFLDGRRKRPEEPYYIPDSVAPTVRPMDIQLPPLARELAPAAPIPRSARASAMTVGKAAQIISACEDLWAANKGDCSAFVKAVSARFGITLNGLADDIVGEISADPWRQLPDGPAAKAAADNGDLVIAGLKGSDQQTPSPHGHVVVVVSGGLAHGLYPTAYWGRLGGVGAKNTTINFAWRAGDRDKVTYAAISV